MSINFIPLFKPLDYKKKVKKPLYFYFAAQLQDLIEKGTWKPKEKIPTERDLSRMAGISLSTVRKALQELENGGYVQRVQGAGTFVTSPETFFGVHKYYGFQDDFDTPLVRHHKEFLGITSVIPDEKIQKYLLLSPEEKTFRIDRLIKAGSVKRVFTSSWVPEKLFSGLRTFDKEACSREPLYALLANKYTMPCRTVRELISVELADEALAALLDIEKNTPLLHTLNIAYSFRDQPFEFRENHILVDNMMLRREF